MTYLQDKVAEYLCGEDKSILDEFFGSEIDHEVFESPQLLEQEVNDALRQMTDTDTLNWFDKLQGRAVAESMQREGIYFLDEKIKMYESDLRYWRTYGMTQIADAVENAVELCEMKLAEMEEISDC